MLTVKRKYQLLHNSVGYIGLVNFFISQMIQDVAFLQYSKKYYLSGVKTWRNWIVNLNPILQKTAFSYYSTEGKCGTFVVNLFVNE